MLPDTILCQVFSFVCFSSIVTYSMSGDSSDLHKKKEEEASLLVPERLKGPIATVASAGTAATIAGAPLENIDLEDKLLKREKNDENNVYQKVFIHYL